MYGSIADPHLPAIILELGKVELANVDFHMRRSKAPGSADYSQSFSVGLSSSCLFSSGEPACQSRWVLEQLLMLV